MVGSQQSTDAPLDPLSGDTPIGVQSIRDLIVCGEARLVGADLAFGHGTDNAFDEATYLVLHALNLPAIQPSRVLEKRVTAQQIRAALTLLERRIRERRPAAYLTREAWLGPNRFYVDERVIVPRSYLAEWIREDLSVWIPRPQRVKRVLDLCTGSGCLAILLAKALPHAQIDATDISQSALAVARRNRANYRLTKRVRLVESDLFKSLGRRRYDLITANPPYVTARAMARLPQEYRYEPRLALSGGGDGMDFLRRILAQAPRHLSRQGMLVMEIGHARRRVERAFPRTPFTWLETSAGDDAIFLLHRDEIPLVSPADVPA